MTKKIIIQRKSHFDITQNGLQYTLRQYFLIQFHHLLSMSNIIENSFEAQISHNCYHYKKHEFQ